MIGYEPQKFSIEELVNNDNKIKMIEATIEIPEVTIKPTAERKVGVTGFNRLSGWSGWGGLHIRSIKNTLILDELLTENIILSITNESDWAQIDLEPYNLILSGDVGLTFEWLEVQGINNDREMKIDDKRQG